MGGEGGPKEERINGGGGGGNEKKSRGFKVWRLRSHAEVTRMNREFMVKEKEETRIDTEFMV